MTGHTASGPLVCESCHTGILVFQQTGAVRAPHARVYKCNCCGLQVLRDAQSDELVSNSSEKSA